MSERWNADHPRLSGEVHVVEINVAESNCILDAVEGFRKTAFVVQTIVTAKLAQYADTGDSMRYVDELRVSSRVQAGMKIIASRRLTRRPFKLASGVMARTE